MPNCRQQIGKTQVQGGATSTSKAEAESKRWWLSPVIQNGELAGHGDVGCFETFDRTNDPSRRQVAARIVFLSDDEDAWMTATCLHNQVMKRLKIIVIGGQENA